MNNTTNKDALRNALELNKIEIGKKLSMALGNNEVDDSVQLVLMTILLDLSTDTGVYIEHPLIVELAFKLMIEDLIDKGDYDHALNTLKYLGYVLDYGVGSTSEIYNFEEFELTNLANQISSVVNNPRLPENLRNAILENLSEADKTAPEHILFNLKAVRHD